MILANISPTDPIIGPSRGSARGWIDWVQAHRETVKRPDDVIAFIDAVYALCEPDDMPDAFLVVAQAFVETGNWTNRWWTERLNAGSLGVTGDDAQNEASPTFKTPMQAARAMVAHDLLYATGAIDRGGLVPADDPRYLAYRDEYGTSVYPTLQHLSGRYAADPFYANKIADRQQAIYPVFTVPVEHPAGGGAMSLYTVAGLSQKIELPVPLIVDLIPNGQTRQRPGITRQTPGYWVQHETANYSAGADAKMHNTWLHNGASGATLSFHFVVDDGAIYQMIPVDEVTWQAADGDGPGNMSGVSCELCVNTGINTAKARHNAEALAGGVCKALGLDASRVKRHWDFNAGSPDRHHCPDEMMNDGYWPTFVNNVGVIIAGGKGNTTVYAPPITYPWLAGNVPMAVQAINKTKVYPIANRYTVLRDTPRKQATGNNKKEVGPMLKAGETFSARYAYRSGGKTYLLTDYGTRVTAADCLPKVQITTSGVVSVRYVSA